MEAQQCPNIEQLLNGTIGPIGATTNNNDVADCLNEAKDMMIVNVENARMLCKQNTKLTGRKNQDEVTLCFIIVRKLG